MTLIHKIWVVLILPKKKSGLVAAARNIVQRMSTGERLRNPSPSLAQVTTLVDELAAADTACKSGTKGTIPVRNEKRMLLMNILGHVRDFVQGVAEANPSEAQAIAESAGMALRRFNPPKKGEFEVRQGKASGEVELIARAVARVAAYQWQWSPDGKSWNDLRPTLQAKTSMSGLTPGTTYWFRFRALTRKVDGDWSQVVTFIVK